ncbi:MAG: tRNA pseudouridine(55) synthase TruB [Gemmatimonadetes bacterium]|nr:tRNA pseudouridine(55) synthase TruB [Gemmatimonadota bacterium]
MTEGEGETPSGVIAVDKPEGPTSHDIVGRVRRALKTRRVGHCGTLDPLATGLLLVCVGRMTKLSDWITGADKQYTATFRLGAVSDTADAQGQISIVEGPPVTLQAIEVAVSQWTGVIQQVPPSYSAIKVDGVRSYKRARRQEEVILPARTVTVSRFEVVEFQMPYLRVVIDCSKGTYIRALARDIGEALGCGAYVETLRRTRIGSVDVDVAVPLEEIHSLAEADPQRLWLHPMAALRDRLPMVGIDVEEARDFTRGRVVDGMAGRTDTGLPGKTEACEVAVCLGDRLLGVGRVENACLHPTRVLTEPTPLMVNLPRELSGPVVVGDGRGRQIGFPTANVDVEERDIVDLKVGVYAARVKLLDVENDVEAKVSLAGADLAVVNLGRRPTFAGTQLRLEAHLLDFDRDLYGAQIQLSLLHRLRGERAFADADALAAQIQADIIAARNFFEEDDRSQDQSQ